MSIATEPTRLRGTFTQEAPKDVERDGGAYGSGLIRGFAVITTGEAMGHRLWVDETFVAQVSAALKNGESVKSRYTHPSLSADGLAKGLGRVTFSASERSDQVRGDLHIWESARKSPDGDLGLHVMLRAEEDPESFGASIAFLRDDEAEDEFIRLNMGEDGSFKSPDERNVNNYPHARLGSLQAVDIVDDPAANPEGLFHRDSIHREAENLLDYAFGFSQEKPELVSFDVDPDRVASFVSKYLFSKGLTVERQLESEAPVETEEVKDEVTTSEPQEETSADCSETDEPTEVSADLSRDDLREFMEAFGDARGARYFADGLSYAEALEDYCADISEENEKLRAENEVLKQSEAEALSTDGENLPEEKRKGLASKIRFSKN